MRRGLARRADGRRTIGRRFVAAALAAVVLAGGCAVGGSTVTEATDPAGGLVAIGAGLQGPAGLKATIYATGLPSMSAFAFDAEGRLWVATSAATDHTEDGVYLVTKVGARPVKVISGLKGPLGLLWVGHELFVAAIGRVDAFSGLQGTRFAHRRLVLKGPVAGAFNNNLVMAPGGRLVMSVSTSCDHCTPASTWSATVVSFRADGGDLRVVAKGIRDGFGLAYDPGTDDLFVTMNQRDDLGAETPGDWLAIVRPGQDWGFPDCYGQGGTACTGVPKPIAVLDPHAAAGGVAIVTGQLGGTIGTSALVAEWSLGTVVRVALTRTGSTSTGSLHPFLTGLKDPLPIVTTSGGAVLVGDWATGTIYSIVAG